MPLIKTLLPVLLLALLANGSVIYNGTCPPITPVPDLQLNRLQGIWYIYLSDGKLDEKPDSRCTAYTYSGGRNGTLNGRIISLSNHGFFVLLPGYQFKPYIQPRTNQTTGRFEIFRNGRSLAFMNVVYIKNNRSFISWDCRKGRYEGGDYVQSLTVMTRDRVPDQQVYDDAMKWINGSGVKTTNLMKMDQDKCERIEKMVNLRQKLN